MSDKKIPEWFRIITVRSYLNAEGSGGLFKDVRFKSFIENLWIEFSKPENLAQIPEVKALLDNVRHANYTGFSFEKYLEPFKDVK